MKHDHNFLASAAASAMHDHKAVQDARPSAGAAHLSYQDQLHVWLIGLRLGIFGQVSKTEYALLIDRDVAVVELNEHSDVPVTARNLRTIVQAFQFLAPPYSATARPPVSKAELKARKAKGSKPTPLTPYEISQLGPHLQGLIYESIHRDNDRQRYSLGQDLRLA